MSIEPTDSPDFNLLCSLHGRCFAPGWGREAFLELFLVKGTLAFVAVDKSGFGVLRVMQDEAEILTIAVMPERRRKGVGNDILGRMLDYAGEQGVKTLFLEVRQSNIAARRLYEAKGFVVISQRKNYYRNPGGTWEDAVVMRKQV